jgi:hypothetical protein
MITCIKGFTVDEEVKAIRDLDKVRLVRPGGFLSAQIKGDVMTKLRGAYRLPSGNTHFIKVWQ